MVHVEYIGGMGNNMFQYALGRIIADNKNYNLLVSNEGQLSRFFKNAVNITDRQHFNDPQLQIGYDTDVGPQNYIERRVTDFTGRIFVKGFFQKQKFFNAYKDQIKKWFETDVELQKEPETDAIVLHVRLGDYLGLGWQLDPNIFIDILRKEKYSKYYIVTDDPNNGAIHHILQSVNGGEVVSTDTITDFEFLRKSSKLVISHSSYSWWASFLGNAKKVIVPYNGDRGLWKINPPENDIDLIEETSKYFRYVYNA